MHIEIDHGGPAADEMSELAALAPGEFVLSQADGRPMYMQIMEQVQQRVAVGDWPSGSKLPSIRELAVALNVSVITVKRAYLELERDSVIVTQQGKGSWVAQGANRQRQLQREELERLLRRATVLARAMGYGLEELTTLLERYEGETSDDGN